MTLTEKIAATRQQYLHACAAETALTRKLEEARKQTTSLADLLQHLESIKPEPAKPEEPAE